MLDAALAYAERGLEIFPAHSSGEKKSHKAGKTSNGKNWGMTKDPVEIERDFRKWPRANIGIPTGKVNKIWVMEADTKEGHNVDGITSLRKLEAENGALPETLMAESPSGSIHYYFNWPSDPNVEIKNSDSELAPGVDVRGEGGMVIAPPSLRPGVGSYRWLNEGTPIADPPDWLIERVRKEPSKGNGKATPRIAVAIPAYIKRGDARGRSTDPNDCFSPVADAARIAAAMAVIPNPDLGWEGWNRIGMALFRASDGSDNGFTAFDTWSKKSKKYDAADTYKKWSDYIKCPPTKIGAGTLFHSAGEADPDWWTEIESEAIEPKPPVADPPATPVVEVKTETAAADTSKVPVDLWAKFDPPPLPKGLLPRVIEEFAIEESELIGADPSGLAMAALAVCAAAIPDYVKLQPKKYDTHWSEAARIWVALIGMPSTKKTPIISRAARPIIQLDRELWREYLKAKASYDDLSAEQKKTAEPPLQTRLRLEDTTIEGAQEVLLGSPNGVLLIQDELSGWFGSLDKYAGHRGAAKDRGFFLQSYNGGSYSLNRIKRGPSYIENLSISMLGGIQPGL